MGGKEKIKHVVTTFNKNIIPIKLSINDIPQIIEIYKSYWGNTGLYKYSLFRLIIEQNLSYAYKIGDDVIGFCLMENNPKEKNIEIALLCIKRGFQGFHLGYNLLSFCLNLCKNLNFHHFSLHVSMTNKIALSLYTKLGFKIEKLIKKYYNDEYIENIEDNDAYYMTLYY